MPICVIDPGHGGSARVAGSSPNNAVGPTGLLEKDVTLDVVQRTAALLQSRGVDVTCTRTSDVNLGLAARADVAKQLGADVFLSIHFNAPGSPSDHTTNGTETWVWDPPPAPSMELAR